MRKIRLQVVLNATTFAPTGTLVIKNPDGTKTVITKEFRLEPDPLSKYTEEQRKTIYTINHLLEENSMEPLTPEEMDWVADPDGLAKRANETTEAELQALSGYRVEKKIIYTEGVKENG